MKTSDPADPRLEKFISAHGKGRVTVLTGAGISAESGIPTFRGAEGYWTVGSRNYHPQEMATWSMFSRDPREVWRWYLYRRSVCRRGRPNAAHKALVELERALGCRFLLITQNVDGLHQAAGQSAARTYPIHGNVHRIRCVNQCGQAPWPFPDTVGDFERETPLDEATWQSLNCPSCEGMGRPHVLWFDETYDEENFRFHSSLEAARLTDLLIVVGTSGATNLPMQVGSVVQSRGAAIVDVNQEDNPFSRAARASATGLFCQGPATLFVPRIVEYLL